jgi:hypothetical protein
MAAGRPPARAQRATKRKEPPSSERSIYFYRADAGLLTSGKPVALDLKPVLERVGDLACADGQRYLAQDDGNVLCAWVDSIDHQRMRLATIRRSGLPLIEQGGNLNGLDLTADQGLYEPIHVQIFENNIIGVEFNFYGPRPSRLSSYLRRVTGNNLCPTFTLNPLLRQDVVAQLNRLQAIRVLELAIRPSYASTVRQADRDLGSAFQAASRVGTPQLVTLRLSPEPHGRNWLGQRVLTAARTLAGRGDMRENTKTFKVNGLDEQTARIEEVDVLRDQLVASKRIVRLDVRSRAVEDGAAYTAISQAYADLKSELEQAASAQLGVPSVGG